MAAGSRGPTLVAMVGAAILVMVILLHREDTLPRAPAGGDGPPAVGSPSNGPPPRSHAADPPAAPVDVEPGERFDVIRQPAGLRVWTHALAVRGRIVDADTLSGIPGLTLWIAGMDWKGHMLASTAVHTDRKGAFVGRLEGQAPDLVSWSLHDARYELLMPVRQEVAPGAREVGLHLLARQRRHFAVRVRTASGGAAKGATVDWALRADGRTRFGQVRAGSDGRAEIPLDDGRLVVTAILPGCERGFLPPVDSAEIPTTLEPVTIILPDAIPVWGWVIGGDGRGVAGVAVRFVLLESEELRDFPWLAGRLVEETVVTKDDGSFLLHSVSPRSVYRAVIEPNPLTGRPVSPVRLRFREGGVILVAVEP